MQSKYGDLTGKIFGKLTVIQRVVDIGRGKIWLCRCDCGKETTLTTGNLVSGNTKSCGCLRRSKRTGKPKDMTGQRFGKLVAIRDTGKRTAGGNVLWECLCDCGKTHVVSQGNLHTGNIRSCGCAERTGIWHYNDLTGQIFGRLTVLSIDHKSYHGNYWKCQCSCGNFTIVRSDGLVTGNTQSCGCLMLDMSKDKAKRLFTKHGLSGTKEYKINKSRKRRELAKKLDLYWTLEMDKAIRQLQPSCVICGSKDALAIDHVLPLIRGNSLKPGNAVVLCKHHNVSKHALPVSKLPMEWQAAIIWNAFQFKDYWESRMTV